MTFTDSIPKVYLDVHLNDKSINTGISQIEINDLLTNSTRSGMVILLATSRKSQKKCSLFGVKNDFVSELVFTPLGLTCLYLKESMFFF